MRRPKIGGPSVIEAPNGGFPNTDLADGDFADEFVPLFDGQTVTVKLLGCVNDSGNAPSSLTVQLIGPGGATIASENTIKTVDSSGIASYSNNSGSIEVARLRLDNSTGAQQNCGATFGYEIG